jgi:molybdate transport system substrate-binding protein
MNKILFFTSLLFLLFGNSGCNNDAATTSNATLNVAVAANMQFAMKEIEKAFETNHNLDINVILGSSGKLTTQIKQGAPYDLLLSANMKYPETLYKEGHAVAPPKVYALGSLVLWTLYDDLPLDADLKILSNEIIQKIGIANPKNAPYGEEALNAFKYFNLLNQIEDRLVYGESIAQTNQYIITKNCKLGLTAKSVVKAPEMQGKGQWIDVNPAAYTPIKQGLILTKYGAKQHKEAAMQFYNFLFSSTAQQVFEKYGYTISTKK